MTEQLINNLVSVLLGGSLTAWWAARTGRLAEKRTLQRSAATDLVAPLRSMRTLMRVHGRTVLDRANVIGAINDWDEVLDRHRHRLPREWTHIDRSIRGAFGTVFGAVAHADVRPDYGDLDLAEPDFTWQDHGDEFLGYVASALLRWGDGHRSVAMVDFDEWLRLTERHDPQAMGWRGRA